MEIASKNDELIRLARELGEALRESPAVQAYLQAGRDAAQDGEAARLKALVETAYDDLVQRQNAGEVISGGELDEYFKLEREMKAHPALARQAQAFERMQDLMTSAHDLLTNELGFSFIDLVR